MPRPPPGTEGGLIELAEASKDPAKPARKSGKAAKEQQVVPPRILIVQDNQVLAKLLVNILEEVGAETTIVPDCRRAIDSRYQATFDLVLIDWLLADQTGENLLKTLKERKPKIPVVAISALAHKGDFVERVIALGAVQVVKKPFQIRELLTTLDRVLSAS